MTYSQFENEYRRERRFVSLFSALMMLAFLIAYAYLHPHKALEAFAQGTDVFTNVIRGIAQ